MNIFVTGAAGFIGSSLVDCLIEKGHSVVGYDNLSTGQPRFLEEAARTGHFRFVEGDLLDLEMLRTACRGCEIVFHFAANADVRYGANHPRRDLEQNTIATFNVLEAMRLEGVKCIVFSSTGSVYGETAVFPTPEDAPFPIQTSLYGASKVAGEGLITAYAEAFGMRALIFRFVSILGPRYTHGHVFDFLAKLRRDPNHLAVLGNGMQRKSYLHINDCIAGILTAVEKAEGNIEIFNLGTEEYCQVRNSIDWIIGRLGLTPEISFGDSDRGWIGDNPFIFLDTTKIRSLGWRPKFSIRESVLATVDFLRDNSWVFEARV